ncbi:uncharacterized protein Pyn_25640 [Prunus yedoensis var. nudiflora]|uniref:Uncharacterized protein n=1 Tax=Prunus yedoensis var. nudiflora TaxID=2094558 RepID=A0A314Y152_PRUYE|nr:uncharacterized protein Pyn_25640 [Prunus yedoensis var. nudiflora]
MGRRGGAKRTGNTAYGSNNTISLREELTGKKQTKGPAVNAKSALKLEHLQRLAVWAGGEASVPSLGAFFAHTLASAQEALGVPPDPSLFPCQRCETILQPGLNCTVRIEKNRSKKRRKSKKPTSFSQNNVVYTCHFCSHRNLKRGTPRGHMKVICPTKTKTTSKLKPAKSISKKFVSSKKSIVAEYEVRKANEIASSEIAREIQGNETASEIAREIQENETASSEIAREIQENETASSEIAREIQENETASSEIARENHIVETQADEDEVTIVNEMASSAIAGEIPMLDSPETPKVRTGPTLLLGGKRRKRNKSVSKKPAEPENNPNPTDAENTGSMSNKRRRKKWTSLKEIAESSEHKNIRNISDLTIPFFV